MFFIRLTYHLYGNSVLSMMHINATKYMKGRVHRCEALFILALGLVSPLQGSSGLSTNGPSISYTRTVWRVSDGLPENTVQALAESPDGLLWIGTTGGLTSFGGSKIRLNATGLAQSLGVNSIFSVLVAVDGSIWAGTEGGGLLHLKGDLLKVFSTNEGLTDAFVRSVFQDNRKRIWVGTDNGLFLLEGDHLRRIDASPQIPSMAVHSIAEDREQRIWVGGSRLIAINVDGSSREYPLPGDYSKNRVKTVLQTADGTMWVGTVGGLERLSHGRFESFPGIHGTVRTLLQTGDRTLWIGTIGEGVWTLSGGGRLLKVQSPGLLPSETVLSILQDHEGQVWIGTQAGLVRLDRTPVTLIRLPKTGDPDFETISGDARGDVWVAAQNLYLIQGGIAREVTFRGLRGVSVRNVFRARDGATWVGTDGSGAYRITKDEVRHYSAPKQLTNNFVRAFLEDRDGTVWIATDEGVSAIGRTGIQKFMEISGLAYFSTRSLLQDHEGKIWIGTDHGLSVWWNGSFHQNAATRVLAHEKIWAMLEDRQRTLWFGTRDHGMFRLIGDAVQQYATEQGLPTNSIYQLLQDRAGTFWLTGTNTIASIGEAQMDGAVPSPDHPLSVTMYSMPFGAEDAQLYGGREPAGYLAPDNTVWLPTSRGAAHISISEKDKHTSTPRATIDGTVVDGQAVPLESILKLHAGTTRVSFRFSAIYLKSPTEVRFRYKLEGFDPTWIVAGPDNIATYTNLAARQYRFRVQAFDSSNPAAATEADVALNKSPQFYETRWFYLSLICLLAAIAWLVYKLRVRRIRTRFSAVLEERNRMAREMHDTVIQGCTGVSALLEALASTATSEAPLNPELLDFARQQTRTTIDEARQAVWNMRHEHENGVDLMQAMHGLATQTMREHKEIVATVDGDEIFPLRSSVAHEMLMTVREAVYNAVQHSGTARIDLNAEITEDHISISIIDYGRGFAPDRFSGGHDGHYGIVGMKERMKRLGGNFELTTVPGVGTTARLIVHMDKLKATERP